MNARLSIALVSSILAGCSGMNATPGPAAAANFAAAPRVTPDKSSYKRALYILNAAQNSVQILTNTYYRQLGTITSGISNPQGMTVDKRGNLYVANRATSFSDVAEYAPGATSPSFTYSLPYPAGIAVDRLGNVFVTNWLYGTVNQFFQGTDHIIATCNVGQHTQGVAVDANGDVFVTSSSDVGVGIYELTGGLSGCNATLLMTFQYAYPLIPSLAIDANNNLLFGFGPNVNVIDPPYTSVTNTIGSGFSSVSGLSLNKKNKLLFVSDSVANTVTVINYQTGATVKQLGLRNGITQANGVVDAPNAVY